MTFNLGEREDSSSGKVPRPVGRGMPVSTYRLQFHRGFTFSDAAAFLSYVSKLGITDCYSSPYLMAHPGSTHGYDICDHNRLNPELGSEEDYDVFISELTKHGMGQILDFVPNHMGANPSSNKWWRDVLENGPSSPYAGFFDIDWKPVKDELENKILLPILGDQYGTVLERGELRLDFEDGALILKYYEHNLPINPRQSPKLFGFGLESLQLEVGEENPDLREFLSILTSLHNLPVYTETDPLRIVERQREKEVARERLARLAQSSLPIRRHIENNVQVFNGRPAETSSFDRLHDLLEAQAYRLAYWRTAGHEINFRRFFDINSLVGLRMEDENVFAATHGLILRLIGEGKITGLRLDHVDGLYDPQRYFLRLQEAIRNARTATGATEDPEVYSPGPPLTGFYLLVEKILSANESLPEGWAVHGTTGYEFLNDLGGLFLDARMAHKMKRSHHRFTGYDRSLSNETYEAKKIIMTTFMASELNVLATALNRISEHDRRSRDFTLESLKDALMEVVACFPVYRTYVSESGWTETDQQIIETALSRSLRRNPVMGPLIFEFLRSVLLPAPASENDGFGDEEYRRRLNFALKFQQYTGPVQAKGLEDTAFYRYNILISLNEVGGEPQRFGRHAGEFHESNLRRLTQRPYSMLATSTHDTKRGEDARVRIDSLTEMTEDWRRGVFQWSRLNGVHKILVDGEPAPDRNDEYLFYQSLVGAWPAEPDDITHHKAPEGLTERMRDFMLKAIREAKVHTSWIHNHQAYENAVVHFTDRALTSRTSEKFLASFLPLQRRAARLGMINSLSQLILKIASPGVPDFYQGSELWNLSLVDPDNRRLVDRNLLEALLDGLEPLLQDPITAEARCEGIAELLKNWHDGRIKLYLTARTLRFRRQEPELFLRGEYHSLWPEGDKSDHVVALSRQFEGRTLIIVVPRLVSLLMDLQKPLPFVQDCWGETTVPLPLGLHRDGAIYVNILTGESIQPSVLNGHAVFPLREILKVCPVAMLLGGEDSVGFPA